MTRKTILTLAIVLLLLIVLLAVFIYRASPGPADQDILGITLGGYDNPEVGVAHISGRRLNCTPEANPPYTSTCTMDIANQPLTVQSFRNDPREPNQLTGGCTAVYEGQTWPCQINSRHVTVHWFAHISDPLGLDHEEMKALRQQYYIENLPEDPFILGIWLSAVIVTVLILIILFSWRYPPRKRTWLAAIIIAPATLLATLLFAVRLTSGFWD
ncbi:MAG: hypothetical protein R3293_09365 [Candidatus Promineifilaceae bacterium]|nr:hypothetical protein [Candidatus Promineifilaceae bacterium]